MPQPKKRLAAYFSIYIFDSVSYSDNIVNARFFNGNILYDLFIGQITDKLGSGHFRLEKFVTRHIVVC